MDFLEEELEEILNIFREESEEYLQKINQNLLKLEANPKDGAVISELFREAHSLKGAARMIGLTDIQSIAHKIEDIFGMAKERTLKVTPEIIDVLCKSVDTVASIVEKSIETRGEYHTADVDKMLEMLENIKITHNPGYMPQDTSQKQSEPASKDQKSSEPIQQQTVQVVQQVTEEEEKPSLSEDFYKNFTNLIPEVRVLLLALTRHSHDGDSIKELYKLTVKLEELTADADNYDLKECVQDMKIKLDGVVKGSGILLDVEITELEETFNRIIEIVKGEFKTETVPAEKVITLTEAAESMQETKNPEPENPYSPVIELKMQQEEDKKDELDLDFISKNIILISHINSDNEGLIDQLIAKLNDILKIVSDDAAKKIFDKILEIINYSKDSGVKPSVEIADIIKQSFDTAQLMHLTSSSNVGEDPDMVVQRLAILTQMLKLSGQDNSSASEAQDENIGGTSIIDYSQSPKTEILSGDFDNTSKPIPLTEDKSSSDTTTIKTLRVDTKKLDQLVTQVGELIISKIKAKEHLTEVEKITRSIEDWYREWNKAKQFLKHLEKKPIKPVDLPAGTSIYSQNKNVYSFFEDWSGKLSGLINQMNALYKIIQEDDTRLNLIVNELEERIKSVRVLPLATIFHMFPRMVRDIAREKGKDIELVISGSETSVDKKIIEEIKSPLIHIIRNAIDHGIEDPQTRINNGKNPCGKIFLSAYHLENCVLIEIIDDGRGIDLEVIKRKALQKNLLTQQELQGMNDEQIMNILFWPGFSTGEVVTDISGRGVGLDIVYTKISHLNGKVNIKSTLGQGCKLSIQLPVTMATIKAFLVRINNQTFAIPTSAIKTALLIKPKDIFHKEGKETIIVDNRTIPLFKLSSILEMPEQKIYDDKIVVIVIQSEEFQVGFIIDKLIGDQEILHKNLTQPLVRVRNVAGITTLASGDLCLILNVNDLIKSSFKDSIITRRQVVITDDDMQESNTKKNVLVVDDSVTTRILERNILRAAGFNVTIAVNGLDALTKVLSENYDLIVTDVEMPEINGFELTERLKKDEKYKHIPIILVTSLASEVDKKRGYSLGANAYITKGGFDQGELLNTINKLITG